MLIVGLLVLFGVGLGLALAALALDEGPARLEPDPALVLGSDVGEPTRPA